MSPPTTFRIDPTPLPYSATYSKKYHLTHISDLTDPRTYKSTVKIQRHYTACLSFLKQPIFKNIQLKTTAAFNPIQRQKSHCTMSIHISIPTLFAAPPILQTFSLDLTVDQ